MKFPFNILVTIIISHLSNLVAKKFEIKLNEPLLNLEIILGNNSSEKLIKFDYPNGETKRLDVEELNKAINRFDKRTDTLTANFHNINIVLNESSEKIEVVKEGVYFNLNVNLKEAQISNDTVNLDFGIKLANLFLFSLKAQENVME